MAQVTMTGSEYVGLMEQIRKAEAERDLFIEKIVIGRFVVNRDSSYAKVSYECMALPDIEEMYPFFAMRVEKVKEELENNPLAVQLLYDEKDIYYNPRSSNFTNWCSDRYVPAIKDMSDKLAGMWQTLEDGDRLIEVPEEPQEEIQEEGK